MNIINSSIPVSQNPPNNHPLAPERPHIQCSRNIISPRESALSPRNQENLNPNNAKVGSGKLKNIVKEEVNEDIKRKEEDPSSGFYYNKRGEERFKKGEYKEAIEEFTKAIGMNDTESMFYWNRARAYKQLGDLQKAYEDVNISIELDDQNVEAQYLGGKILAEMGKTEIENNVLEKGLNRINKALALCTRKDQTVLKKEINKTRLRIKKVIWLKEEKIKKEKHAKAFDNIMGLLGSDTAGVIAGLEPVEHSNAKKMIKEYAGKNENKYEIPDELCCKITMELMEEPVVAQSGMTYEKSALMDHLKRNRKTDPITRKPIDDEYIFENIALKQKIEEFVEKNPWAFEYSYNENYLDIKF